MGRCVATLRGTFFVRLSMGRTFYILEVNMNPYFYMHDSDRIALQALKAIPGFTQLFKAFMKVWSEKQFRIQNMSTNLRISEKQLPKYYEMLPPICEKLGIEVPELYLELDVVPNAYTAGDTKPFIVMTSRLLETMPEELIPTVLAHECGHIACRHSLYTTMGRIILSEAINYLGLSDLAVLPIQVAFSYWMRCSELSADRAAAICDGNADNIVEMCMRFAGFGKNIMAEANVDEFMNQALEYREMVADSKWNKTLEFLILSQEDHPLNAVRAYECSEWAKTERFTKITKFVDSCTDCGDIALTAYLQEVPMPEASKHYVGKNIAEVQTIMQDLGFVNVKTAKITQKGMMVKNGQVLNIRINGKDGFNMCDWYPIDSDIVIEYYEPETEEEIAAAHPGQIRVPNSSKYYLGRVYTEAVEELQNAGFATIEVEEQRKDKKGLLSKNGGIAIISINGQTQFEKGEWFAEQSTIRIVYHTYAEKVKK